MIDDLRVACCRCHLELARTTSIAMRNKDNYQKKKERNNIIILIIIIIIIIIIVLNKTDVTIIRIIIDIIMTK